MMNDTDTYTMYEEVEKRIGVNRKYNHYLNITLILFVFVQLLRISTAFNVRPTGCTQNEQCTAGYYCNTYTYLCNKCINCQQGREFVMENTTPNNRSNNCTSFGCGPLLRRESKADRSMANTTMDGLTLRELNVSKYVNLHVIVWIIATCAGVVISFIFFCTLSTM